jgi:hypothetical protein
MADKNSWDTTIKDHIKRLIPSKDIDIRKTLDVGISLPDVGGVDESTKLNPILVFFLVMPYFGIRKARDPSPRDPSSGDRAAREPESLSLSEYSSKGAIQSTYHSENEIWVHRAWLMIFFNGLN